MMKKRDANLEELFNNHRKNLANMKNAKIIMPYEFFNNLEAGFVLYTESLYCYLFGFSNSAVTSILKCFEICLKQKYRIEEKEEPTRNLNLHELIDWGEKWLGNKKELAHGFRILRNLIHEEKTIENQDALEAIRHVSKFLNLLWHLGGHDELIVCEKCKSEIIIVGVFPIGTIIPINCKCGENFQFLVYPYIYPKPLAYFTIQ
jgi:hypothetical protein